MSTSKALLLLPPTPAIDSICQALRLGCTHIIVQLGGKSRSRAGVGLTGSGDIRAEAKFLPQHQVRRLIQAHEMTIFCRRIHRGFSLDVCLLACAISCVFNIWYCHQNCASVPLEVHAWKSTLRYGSISATDPKIRVGR